MERTLRLGSAMAMSNGSLTFLIVAFFMASWTVSAQQAEFFLPLTLSPEARAALGAFTSAGKLTVPEPDDVDGFIALQATLEEILREKNAKIVEDYQATVRQRRLGGVSVLDIKPRGWNETGKVLVYTHGGAYTLFSADSMLTATVPVAADTGLRVISVNYTLAPVAKWEQIVDEVVTVLRILVYEDGIPLHNMAVYGDSSGGSLAASAVLKMRDSGFGLPAAAVLWSPWSDINETGDTYFTLRDHDPVVQYRTFLDHSSAAYAEPRDYKNPYVSPVYGDYTKGFPPTMFQVGTKETFLSNSVRHYQALDNAGVETKLDVYEGMWHVWQVTHTDLPETILARKKMANFLEKHMGKKSVQ